jgi:hypothetical protein
MSAPSRFWSDYRPGQPFPSLEFPPGELPPPVEDLKKQWDELAQLLPTEGPLAELLEAEIASQRCPQLPPQSAPMEVGPLPNLENLESHLGDCPGNPDPAANQGGEVSAPTLRSEVAVYPPSESISRNNSVPTLLSILDRPPLLAPKKNIVFIDLVPETSVLKDSREVVPLARHLPLARPRTRLLAPRAPFHLRTIGSRLQQEDLKLQFALRCKSSIPAQLREFERRKVIELLLAADESDGQGEAAETADHLVQLLSDRIYGRRKRYTQRLHQHNREHGIHADPSECYCISPKRDGSHSKLCRQVRGLPPYV